MAFLRRYLRGILVFAALAADAATPREKSMPSPVRAVTADFTVFARERPADVCFFAAGGEARALRFFTQGRSPVYRHRGGPEILFYRASTVAAAAGGKNAGPQRPVARAVIPPDVSRALLVFAPLREPTPEGIEFSVAVVDDGPARLPAGGVAVLNLAARTYRGSLGGQRLRLPPGASEAVSPGGGAVDFRLACEDAGRWVAAGRFLFKPGPRERTWLVLFPPDARTGIAPVIRRLSDEPAAGAGGD